MLRVSDHHLAQVNIARMKAPLDSRVMEGFVARLDEINALFSGPLLSGLRVGGRVSGGRGRWMTPEGGLGATQLTLAGS